MDASHLFSASFWLFSNAQRWLSQATTCCRDKGQNAISKAQAYLSTAQCTEAVRPTSQNSWRKDNQAPFYKPDSATP